MVRQQGRPRASDAAAPPAPGTTAPAFALHDTPHSRVGLDDFRGRTVVLAFYVADWHPVASAQLALYQELLPHLERLDAAVLGISVDATWSHDAFSRATGIRFPLLADDAPPGAVARAYGVYVPETGRSRRALFVIDRDGIVRWSATFHDAVNPGADGVLSALESLRPAPTPSSNVHNDLPDASCPCGCGLRLEQVGLAAHAPSPALHNRTDGISDTVRPEESDR
jgi:peroxiredoxin